jgi:hypothetical protein
MKTNNKYIASIASTPLIALTALAISATANAASLITNGSFEQGAPYGATYTAPTGWATIGGDTAYGPGSTWGLTPPDGTQLAIIGGTDSFNAGIKTTWFSVTQGQQYTFSFDATGQAAYDTNFNPVAWEQWKMGVYYTVRYTDGALSNTTAVEGATFPVAVNNWTTTSGNFTAAQSGFATMEVFLYNNGWTPNRVVYSAVDNFNLEAVPEPTSLGLLGLSSVLLLRRRRA